MTDHHSRFSEDIQDSRVVPQDTDQADGPPASKAEGKKSGSMVREVIETLLLALLIFVAVRAVVLNFRVDGESMTSALADNEMLLVNRNAYFGFEQEQWLGWIPGVDYDEDDTWYPFGTPERGDIVVLNPPSGATANKPYIKRVIGLPGERVTFNGNNVFIDGIQLNEPYIIEATGCAGSQICDAVVPEGHVWVLGDNRNNSSDSRTFGVVDVDDIIGKAWIGYWPRDEIGIVDHYDYPEISDR